MHARFAALTTTILVASFAAASATASRAPVSPAPTVEILVNGVPRPQYDARGRSYIEALKGQEYEIRLRNPYPVRVAVALSVDGLNTIDARESTAADARKWVLAPFETVTIRGWQTSRTDARRFEFTSEDRSYGASLGKVDNLGVIAAVFYRERVQAPRYTQSRPQEPMPAAPMRDGADRMESRAKAEQAPGPAASAAAGAAGNAPSVASDEYAATGMGRRTDHAVTQVWLDLEDQPVASVALRYEFRPALVRLGVLPAPATRVDPLSRRERARGFEHGFCPRPPQR